jgi:hypothetical protein
MRFVLRHPLNPQRRAEYGWEGPSGLGFFVHVRESGTLIGRYDALVDGYDIRYPLWHALVFMVAAGFFSRADLEETLTRASHELPEEMPRRLRRIAMVVGRFKEAAD